MPPNIVVWRSNRGSDSLLVQRRLEKRKKINVFLSFYIFKIKRKTDFSFSFLEIEKQRFQTTVRATADQYRSLLLVFAPIQRKSFPVMDFHLGQWNSGANIPETHHT
jgi:hypothetical protein